MIILNKNKTSTHLQYSTNFNLKTPLRFGHTGVITMTKKISPQILLEQKNLIINKFIFLRYCEHFKNKSLSDLLNDSLFIKQMHESIHNEPTLFSRAFQLALEVTYSKRCFSQESLQQMYKNDFIIKDTFKVNNGICDQSTIYSSILTKKVSTYFNLNVEDLVVNSTPIFLTKDKITEPMQISMDYNKKMTENTCPDIEIKGRPYDFKEPKDISYGKNQIYFIDIQNIQEKGHDLFNKLEKSLLNSKNSLQINLSNEARMFTDSILKKLQEQNGSQKCIEELNIFLMKAKIPKDFKMPLFIPMKKAFIEVTETEKHLLDNVPLEKGFLEQSKAKKAIMGVLDTYDFSIKANIQKATHGSIQFNIPKLEEVD